MEMLQARIGVVLKSGPCTLDQVVERLAARDWWHNTREISDALDRMGDAAAASRDGLRWGLTKPPKLKPDYHKTREACLAALQNGALTGRRIAQNARAAGCRSYTEATITEVLRDLEEEGVVDGPAHGDELVGVWSVVRDEGPGTASDTASTPSDPVNHPAHYNTGGIEVIDAIYAWGLDSDFALANAVKYIARAGKKGPDKLLEDLRKARWYLDWRIRKIEGKYK
jgi:hypothetical protein